jgi:hypothetical protein
MSTIGMSMCAPWVASALTTRSRAQMEAQGPAESALTVWTKDMPAISALNCVTKLIW